MLKTLKNLTAKEAQDLLSAATKTFLPNPGIEPFPAESTISTELQEQLLEEVRQHLGLEASDHSAKAKIKFLEFLTKEMGEYALKDTKIDLSKVKAHLGQIGGLRSDLYAIKFGQSFYKITAKRGVSRRDVEETIRQPDNVEHFQRGTIINTDESLFSFYAKTFVDQTSKDRFTLLVSTKRDNDTLLVDCAWRIYHSDVDLSNAHKPLDVLRSFVEVYGIPFQVGRSRLDKFFLYETTLILPGQQMNNLITFPAQKGIPSESHFTFRISSLNVVEIGIAYLINISKYCDDLRKHGLTIPKKL